MVPSAHEGSQSLRCWIPTADAVAVPQPAQASWSRLTLPPRHPVLHTTGSTFPPYAAILQSGRSTGLAAAVAGAKAEIATKAEIARHAATTLNTVSYRSRTACRGSEQESFLVNGTLRMCDARTRLARRDRRAWERPTRGLDKMPSGETLAVDRDVSGKVSAGRSAHALLAAAPAAASQGQSRPARDVAAGPGSSAPRSAG